MDTPGIMATSRNKLDTAMMKNVKTALNQARAPRHPSPLTPRRLPPCRRRPSPHTHAPASSSAAVHHTTPPQGDVLLAIVDSAAALTLEKPEDGLEGLRSAATSGGPQLCVVLNKARGSLLKTHARRVPGVRHACRASARRCARVDADSHVPCASRQADLVDDEGRKRLEEAYRKLPGVDQARRLPIELLARAIWCSLKRESKTLCFSFRWNECRLLCCLVPPLAPQVMFTSAKEGGGVQDLADWVVSRLPMGPTLYPKDQARGSSK